MSRETYIDVHLWAQQIDEEQLKKVLEFKQDALIRLAELSEGDEKTLNAITNLPNSNLNDVMDDLLAMEDACEARGMSFTPTDVLMKNKIEEIKNNPKEKIYYGCGYSLTK